MTLHVIQVTESIPLPYQPVYVNFEVFLVTEEHNIDFCRLYEALVSMMILLLGYLVFCKEKS